MKKLATANLGLIVTEKCNLNCAHCLMGGCTNKVMSDEVIVASLAQFKYIMNLSICGGEPLLALDRIEKIFSYVIENKILVDNVSITINGTIYNDTFLNLLKYIEEFINWNKQEEVKTNFRISHDIFHKSEVERLYLMQQYLENVKQYSESPYFCGFAKLGKKLVREGNAENLSHKLTIPLEPYSMIMTYVGNNMKMDMENGFCYIGPYITINVDGIITECDASNKHQSEMYNYGNVLTDSIEDIFLNRNARILKPQKWNKSVNKEIIRYLKKFN